LGDASMGVIRLGWIVGLVVIFAENGLGNDIFFSGPVSEILQLAALAAEREFGVHVGVGRLLANRTAVLHGPFFFSVTTVRSMAKKHFTTEFAEIVERQV
jgi:hypothetical protein